MADLQAGGLLEFELVVKEAFGGLELGCSDCLEGMVRHTFEGRPVGVEGTFDDTISVEETAG